MGSVGVPELIVIFTVALLVFGPRKLPEIGRSLGKALKEFQRARSDLMSTLEQEVYKTEHELPGASQSSTPGSKLDSYPHHTVEPTLEESVETKSGQQS